MKYTNEQIRGAILRAADRIERNPTIYSFSEVECPNEGSCGSPHCMLGWIGFELGSKKRLAHQVAMEIAGYKFSKKHDLVNSYAIDFYSFCKSISIYYQRDAAIAAMCMRAYANKFFPAEPPPVRPVVAEDRQLVRWEACVWKPSGVRA